MERLIDQQLAQLDAQFTEMGVLVAKTIDAAGKAMVVGDQRTAKEIVAHDHQINDREMKLEQDAFEIIALQQPVTSDLREVVTILKAVSDLEHAGDHARDIALASLNLQREAHLKPVLILIEQFSKFTEKLMRDMLMAYVKKDWHFAQTGSQLAIEANEQHVEIYQKCVLAMKQNSEQVEQILPYVAVANSLEQIVECALNIGEWIIYRRTGEIVELKPTIGVQI
ncbi:phosphate transport system regulatory protein [Paucilactobacillus hokkaidonensis JCM 18461]|uniref:Phosphate-specific transport system accessory protein PhoU n=2 Tax=Paucilactobacillus hokkaidonensis TaxID=1193095 RepID=A0A0A1GYY3_9LACO|nr:phosphate signaling complex protein PhoU [Paucilactobacillus hokkaidonensis]KRO10192.1 phosphate transport system protein [Paucilactobacillus hokkaidonensis]BAP86208.1 phosphate transport system regulatory protein [Paucilactobacillus hokkaidonensis JCM 18461]